MNRRSLLALMGGSVAAPAAGVKAAAEALGISAATAVNVSEGLPSSMGDSDDYWNSPLAFADDTRRQAIYETNKGMAYPHMKSWGRAFRISVVQRDEYLLRMYQQKMRSDETFRDMVLRQLGLVK